MFTKGRGFGGVSELSHVRILRCVRTQYPRHINVIAAGFFAAKISYLIEVYIKHWQTLAVWLSQINSMLAALQMLPVIGTFKLYIRP